MPIIIKNKSNLSIYTSILNHFNVYYHWVIYNVIMFGNTVLRYWDRGLVELIGPMGLVKLIHHLAFIIELLSTGRLIQYALILILIPVVFIVSFINPSLFLLYFLLIMIIGFTL